MCSAVVPETNELLRNTRSSRLPDMSAALLLLTTILGAEGAAAAARPAPAAGPGKLAPAVAKEMTESIVAVNKALGLESWPSHGATPCVDRGGQGITAKSVTAEDTRKCANTAIEKNFPELGKSYVLAIPMVSLGPMTVIALGIGDADGWGAYSCDPQRKCTPVKLSAFSEVEQARGRAEGQGVQRSDDVVVPGRSEGVRGGARGGDGAPPGADDTADGREVARVRLRPRSADPDARVAEQAHPGAVVAPRARPPRILDGAEDAFGMGHEDRDAAVA